MNQQQNADVMAGQDPYNPFFLHLYDFLILKVSNSLIWRCPSRYLKENFDRHMTPNHLDIGVGTGYFLAKSKKSAALNRVGLLDLNINSLTKASQRLEKKGITSESYNEDALSNPPLSVSPFDSVSLNYLFHCLPGDIGDKVDKVITHIKPSLSAEAKIFGATILGKGVEHKGPAKKLITVYNEKKIFTNTQDDLESLREALDKKCINIEISVRGCVAIFSGSINPQSP